MGTVQPSWDTALRRDIKYSGRPASTAGGAGFGVLHSSFPVLRHKEKPRAGKRERGWPNELTIQRTERCPRYVLGVRSEAAENHTKDCSGLPLFSGSI